MKKIMNYLAWVPFAVSIGSLIIYLRYAIAFKLDSNLVVTDEIKETLNGYLIIVFISLFIGLLIILFKKIYNLIKYSKNEVKSLPKKEYKIISKDETVNNEEFINAIENSNRTISINESNFMKYIKNNKVIKIKLSEPILGNSVKGKVIDTDEDIEILLLDEDIKDLKNSIKCSKCAKVLSENAFICTNCGVLINKELLNEVIVDFEQRKILNKTISKSKKFNFAVFLANFMIIILCIFLIFLIGNKIENQREENYNNIGVITEKE